MCWYLHIPAASQFICLYQVFWLISAANCHWRLFLFCLFFYLATYRLFVDIMKPHVSEHPLKPPPMCDSLRRRFLRCPKASKAKSDGKEIWKAIYPKNPPNPPPKVAKSEGKSQMLDGLHSLFEVLTAHSCGLLQTYWFVDVLVLFSKGTCCRFSRFHVVT